MSEPDSLSDKRILVTGATGFIGGRLATRLATEHGASVTGTGRDLEKAAHLRAHGIALLQADIADRAAMASAVTDQDIVFHIAAYLGEEQDPELAQKYNVDATAELMRLSAAAGVGRVVYTSSVAAYGPNVANHPHVVEGKTPIDTEQPEAYGRSKAVSEGVALALAESLPLALVIVRPGMVYGPGSYGWSVSMLKLVQSGTPVLFGEADGLTMPIYIDNLVDLLIAAAVTPAAAGEVFNGVDEGVSYRDWFGHYGRMAGKRPRRVPLPLAYVLAHAAQRFKLPIPLSPARLQFITMKSTFSMEKAERVLGFLPKITLDEGMAHTETWLRAQGYLDR